MANSSKMEGKQWFRTILQTLRIITPLTQNTMSKSRKTLLALLSGLLLMPSAVQADDVTMVVEPQGDAASWEVALSQISTMKLTPQSISVEGETTTLKTFELASIKRITFKGLSTGISLAESTSSAVAIERQGGYLYVKGADAALGSGAQIYAVDGRRVATFRPSQGEGINLATLPAGVYVLKVGMQSFKFTK